MVASREIYNAFHFFPSDIGVDLYETVLRSCLDTNMRMRGTILSEGRSSPYAKIAVYIKKCSLPEERHNLQSEETQIVTIILTHIS